MDARQAIRIFAALLLLVAVVILPALAWMLYDVQMEGLADQLTRFESEPPEGNDYWWWYDFNKHLPGNVLFYSVLLITWVAALIGLWSLLRKSLRPKTFA